MQLTKEQLKQIIKEELEATLNEGPLGDRRRAASKQIGDKIKQMDHYINMQPSLVNLQDIQDMIPRDLRMDVEDVANNLMNHNEYDSVVKFLDLVMRRR